MSIKLRKFSDEKYDYEANQTSFNDKDTPGEGLVHGEYNDFYFNYKVNGKDYQLRFDSSTYGDDEFDAVVHMNDGIATLWSNKDFERFGKDFINEDDEFLN